MPFEDSRLAAIENPWLRDFLAGDWAEIIIGQILARRSGEGVELRHVDDAGADAGSLKNIRASEARALANFNAAGAFRPLKSSRDLKAGWILRAGTPSEVEEALQHFYPGALPDRFALRATPPPITGYREYVGRQTGMYRITTFLADADLERVIARVCSALCLKQRLWTSGEIPTDAIAAKSAIPCLEPCAILLEAARKEVRALQESAKSAAGG